MTMTTPWCPDRRLLLRLGTLGVGALAMPGAAQVLSARGFTHGVASGEPSANSVLLWTRYVGASAETFAAETVSLLDMTGAARRTIAGSVDLKALCWENQLRPLLTLLNVRDRTSGVA